MGSERKIIPLWIDNKEVSSTLTFPVTNSERREHVHEAFGATPDIAIAAVESAQKAFITWRETDVWRRRRLLQDAAEYLHQHREEAAEINQLETPVPAALVQGLNIGDSISLLSELAAAAPLMTNGHVPHTRHANTMALVVKEPYGVHLGIAPWNASLFLALRAVMTPIACGNTAILKGSELCPAMHQFIGRMLRDVGFPPGVLNIIQHRREDAAEIVDALVSHPAVRKVNFTGSTAVGKTIASLCGRHCKPTLMELGGKAPQVVFADADLDKAVDACIVGAYLHHGQICMATEKAIVHESVVDEFVRKLAAGASRFEVTSAVNRGGAEKAAALVLDALEKGAVNVVTPKAPDGQRGGQPLDAEERNHSLFSGDARLRPTALTGVTPAMHLYSQESFGPTLSVHAFATDQEAIRLANDSDFGLSASVFSRDINKAMWAARRIESGAVHINSMTVHDEPQLPHGGVKSSGWGRFGVPWGFDEFLQQKTITITSDYPS